MKQTKKQIKLTGVALAAIVASGAGAVAQSSDAILNKLVQKGVLSQQEADDVRKQAKDDFSKAYQAESGMATWVKKMSIHGDFRGRLDYLSSDNDAFTDRYRLRYRLRAGIDYAMSDNFNVGFALGTGDGGGNPLSNNTTMENNGTKKPIWIDLAYAKWTPVDSADWTASATIGKMRNPLVVSPMEMDPDYTPEGAALQATYKLNSQHSLNFNGGAFVLDELAGSSHDPFMLAGQILWTAKWDKHVETTLGVTGYDIVSKDGLTTANVPNNNSGNTRDAATAPAASFNPVVGSASVTYKLDSMPLYHGAFPIKVAGQYMDNPAASSDNKGWWAGVTFGSSGKKGNWDVSYRYQRLEANAWYEELVDDDNVGFFQSAGATDKSGLAGGTDIQGHLVKLNYSLTDALTFTLTGYFNDLINPSPVGSKSGATHLMADLMWKF